MKRRGQTDTEIENYLRDSLTPFEFCREAVWRSGARERDCFARLSDFKATYGTDDLSVLKQKELGALRQDLAAAIDARKYAQLRLADES